MAALAAEWKALLSSPGRAAADVPQAHRQKHHQGLGVTTPRQGSPSVSQSVLVSTKTVVKISGHGEIRSKGTE